MATTPWNRNETIVAFYVYCQIPFKKSNKSHPLITEYAKILGRSPSALNMKIGNFGRLDPELKQQGIVGGARSQTGGSDLASIPRQSWGTSCGK